MPGVDFTSKILTVGNSSVQLQIWDTVRSKTVEILVPITPDAD
jgi:hypothetical protein